MPIIKKRNWDMVSQLLMSLSIVAVVLSGVGYTGTDIWLASTQWLLVSLILGIFGLYSRMNS